MRDFQVEWVNALADTADRMEGKQGSMRKVAYHVFHLPNEAIEKLRKYGHILPKNKQKARDLLLEAAVACLGEYNRLEGI